MIKYKTAFIAAVTCIALTSVQGATINKWQGGSSGNWTNIVNWNTGFVPSLGDEVARFDDAGEGAVIDSTVPDLYRLEIGRRSASGTLSINTGGSITIDQFRIASDITGGTSSGTVDINGGALTINGGNHGIGYAGTGVVNLNSGTFHSTDNLIVGRGGETANGTLNVSGGALTIANDMTVGGRYISSVATDGAGAFNLSAGTAIMGTDLTVGNGGDGTMTVSGSGDLTVGQLKVQTAAGFSAVANLTGGAVSAGKVVVGENGTLNWGSAATLDTFTNMTITANGLLVMEGDATATIAALDAADTLSYREGVVDIDTLTLGVDYDQVLGSGDNLLVSKFDGSNTSVFTVVPEPATLGLVVSMGAGLLFVCRRIHRI